MDSAINVGNCVVNDLVRVVRSQPVIREQRVSVGRGPGFDVLLDLLMQDPAAAIRDDSGTDFLATLKDPDHGGLVFPNGSGNSALALGDVHVPGLAADEGFVYFDFAGKFAEASGLHGEANSVVDIADRDPVVCVDINAAPTR